MARTGYSSSILENDAVNAVASGRPSALRIPPVRSLHTGLPFDAVKRLQADGYRQVVVFTQYTDTLDFLRDKLRQGDHAVFCFSGGGGEIPTANGWRTIDRTELKGRFRDGDAEILVATDAAAEGLNFQFCGAMINYDLPWNPMRVEQRIGRIDWYDAVVRTYVDRTGDAQPPSDVTGS